MEQVLGEFQQFIPIKKHDLRICIILSVFNGKILGVWS